MFGIKIDLSADLVHLPYRYLPFLKSIEKVDNRVRQSNSSIHFLLGARGSSFSSAKYVIDTTLVSRCYIWETHVGEDDCYVSEWELVPESYLNVHLGLSPGGEV